LNQAKKLLAGGRGRREISRGDLDKLINIAGNGSGLL